MPYSFNPFTGNFDDKPSTLKGNSAFTTVNQNSGNWVSAYTTLCSTSATYATITFVDNKFLPLSGGTITGNLEVLSSVNVGSGDTIFYVSTSNQVGINTEDLTHTLTVNGDIKSNSVIYDNIGNSLQWNSVYSTLCSTSGTYASLDYLNSNFLPLSGGNLTGTVSSNSDFYAKTIGIGDIKITDDIVDDTNDNIISISSTNVFLKIVMNDGSLKYLRLYDLQTTAFWITEDGNQIVTENNEVLIF
jgi:hypothetical protein